jgi:hypothetical protein
MMPVSTNLLLQILRYTLLSAFSLLGIYYLLWAYQSASFSVPADPVMSEIYKTRAMLSLPISLLMLAVGGLAFVCLGSCLKRRVSA